MSLKRILVANRGEIALRVIRAAREIGLETVLAVSSADSESQAAKEADRTVVIGPAPARSSYLNEKLIVHLALSSGCDGLHPGYGFLSERASFAELCENNGITFVGPKADTIRLVGDKLGARELANSSGVPMVPGSKKINSTDEAVQVANEIGYPVITKASAGGGGRGMVVANNQKELEESFDKASHEAREAFGDGTLYLEKYIKKARHVEVQVLGDGEGNIICFGERDCSLQRRYQKMVEEAPATVLSTENRKKLHSAAVELLSPINYRNAGTVEFLYDEDTEQFYFIEVNARIQVEHPVSEKICNVNLVRAQLELASGQTNKIKQDEIRPTGHAIEVRIIAENPLNNFMPSPGRITEWEAPVGENVRVDTAVSEGVLVTPYYDSMIAKLIVYGCDRQEAVSLLSQSLENFHVGGIHTNIALLRSMIAHEDFQNNKIDTRWAERVFLPAYLSKGV